MTPEEALRLIEQGEGQTIEFKETFAAAKEAIESLCAFANAEGGTVFFGVTDEGNTVNPQAGKKTLEDLANVFKANTSPVITPPIYPLHLNDQTVFYVTVGQATRGQVFSAFGRYKIRVGKANVDMPPEQLKARFLEGQPDWSEERDRPRFDVRQQALGRLETQFKPKMALGYVSGDQLAAFEWRFRGPRFTMNWRQAHGSALHRTNFEGDFDLSKQPEQDDKIDLNEMGFEIRFHWRGRWRHELHRWPITRNELPDKVLWDIGEEILPPLYPDEEASS